MLNRGPRQWALAAVVVLAATAGCGPAAAPAQNAGVGAGRQKPADAGRAFQDAVAPADNFSDLTYDQVNTYTSGKQPDVFSGSVTATRNPPRVETRSKPVGKPGALLVSIEDYAAGTICLLQPEPARRLTNQSAEAEQINPFLELKKSAMGWKYLSDINTSGHVQWRLSSNFTRLVPGDSLSGIAEIDIDAQTGRVLKAITTVHTKRDSLTLTSVTTYTNFVYNSGATVAPC
ncbi:MAG: hypothetical protein NVSMB17_00630 [Candidatus Dormibacteria bacterium]